MLDNDLFVRHRVCPVKGINDITRYVRENFGCPVSTADGALLILAAYCLFISYEEIYETFPLNSSRIQTHTIPSLVEKGLLKKFMFSRNIGVSRTCFRITAQGYKRASELCGGELPNKYKEMRTGTASNPHLNDYTTEHTYYVGYNIFSVLSLGIPFEWRREFPFTYGRNYKGSRRKGDLIVDARCSLFPDDRSRYRLLYFEEDTGAEAATVLLDKLEKYRLHHLMDDDRIKDAIIFSFSDKTAGAEANSPFMGTSAYSTGRCRDLIKFMKDNGLTDIFDVLNGSYPDKEFVNELLKVTGVSGKGAGAYGFSSSLDLGFLEEYYLTLRYRRNPYQHRGFNLIHASLSFRRMMRMVEIILSDIGRLPLYARQMAKGFPVYCMPTSLVSERLPFGVLSEFTDETGQIMDTLSSYFDDVRFEGELSPPLPFSTRGDTLRLRNAFTYTVSSGETGLISVEFPSFDLSAWVRAALFLNYIRIPGNKPVQLICVFETTEHYRSFFKMLKVHSDVLCILTDKCSIYGLMLKDIGKDHKIFSVLDAEGAERIELKAAFRSDED